MKNKNKNLLSIFVLLLMTNLTFVHAENSDSSVNLSEEPEINCEEPMNQQEMNICAYRAYQDQDKILNTTYREIKNNLTPMLKHKLKVAELAWIDFQNKSCDFEADFEARGGTIEPLISAGCFSDLTSQRTATLMQIPNLLQSNKIYKKDSSRTLSTLNKAITSIKKSELIDELSIQKLDAAIEAWLQFMNAECDFRSDIISGVEVQADQSSADQKNIEVYKSCEYKMYFDVLRKVNRFKKLHALFKYRPAQGSLYEEGNIGPR